MTHWWNPVLRTGASLRITYKEHGDSSNQLRWMSYQSSSHWSSTVVYSLPYLSVLWVVYFFRYCPPSGDWADRGNTTGWCEKNTYIIGVTCCQFSQLLSTGINCSCHEKTRGFTPDGRQSKTLLRIDERGSKIARNSVFDCHLSPVRRQMAIENSASNYVWSTFVDNITVSIAAYPVWGLWLRLKTSLFSFSDSIFRRKNELPSFLVLTYTYSLQCIWVMYNITWTTRQPLT